MRETTGITEFYTVDEISQHSSVSSVDYVCRRGGALVDLGAESFDRAV